MSDSIYPDAFYQKYMHNDVDEKLLPTSQDVIKKTTYDYGEGIFAQRDFKRGEALHFIAKPISDLLQHSLQRGPNDNLYDPHFIGFLLHSCSPNVMLDMHQQKLFCILDIEKGAPLFMDYASTEDMLFKQFACKCGSPVCRGWITGRNEPVNPEGLGYSI